MTQWKFWSAVLSHKQRIFFWASSALGNCTVAHSPDISEQFQSNDSPYLDDPDFIFYVINLLIAFSVYCLLVRAIRLTCNRDLIFN